MEKNFPPFDRLLCGALCTLQDDDQETDDCQYCEERPDEFRGRVVACRVDAKKYRKCNLADNYGDNYHCNTEFKGGLCEIKSTSCFNSFV